MSTNSAEVLLQPASPPLPDQATSADRAAVVKTAHDWGYSGGAIKSRLDLWHGRRILDVGMGAGPHSISFIEGGAASYVGVDPLLGSDHVRDFRNLKDPSLPAYHAFPYSMRDIMNIYPNVHLYSGLLEDVAAEIKANRVDIALMAAVTEHLERPHDVVRAIWELLEPGGHLWISHCNYYSWTGHHRNPRTVAAWKQNDPEQNKHVDWQHLEPTHPDYSNRNFNRVRMVDLRDVIDKYFEIVEWNVSVEGFRRLTPELRKKWANYTLEELLGQNIYITGRRRDAPLATDLSNRQFHHPKEDYLAGQDHSAEPIAPYTLAHSLFFTPKGEACSHSDNDHAGLRVIEQLRPGDKVTAAKFTNRLNLTVKEIVKVEGGAPRLTFVEPIPESVWRTSRDQWTLLEFGPGSTQSMDAGSSQTAVSKAPDLQPHVDTINRLLLPILESRIETLGRTKTRSHNFIKRLFLRIPQSRIQTLGETEAGAYNFYVQRMQRRNLFGDYEIAIAQQILKTGLGAQGVHEIGPGLGQLTFLLAYSGLPAIGIEIDRKRHATAALMLGAIGAAAPDVGNRCRVMFGEFPLSDSVLPPGQALALATNLVFTTDKATQLKILGAMRRYKSAIVDIDRLFDRRTDEAGRKLTLALIAEAGFKHIKPFLDLGDSGRYFLLRASS
jgi:SAM-dependent methyltransferase